MLEAITSLLAGLGITLPPWGMPAAALVVLLLLSPAIWRNLNTGRARKLLKRASVHEGAERQALEAEALEVVRDSPSGLVAVAEEAQRRGRRTVAEAAVSRLLELEPKSKEARRLQEELSPKLPVSTVEVELMIERLLEAGMAEVARERLAQARARWPRHTAWEALEARAREVAEEAAAGAGVAPATEQAARG